MEGEGAGEGEKDRNEREVWRKGGRVVERVGEMPCRKRRREGGCENDRIERRGMKGKG